MREPRESHLRRLVLLHLAFRIYMFEELEHGRDGTFVAGARIVAPGHRESVQFLADHSANESFEIALRTGCGLRHTNPRSDWVLTGS